MEKARLLPKNLAPQIKHITSTHIPLLQIDHVVTPNSKEGKEMLFSYMPRKKREKTYLNESATTSVPPSMSII